MDRAELISSLCRSNDSKILLLVLDGIGGLNHPDTGLTELQTARTPNLDRIAAEGSNGLLEIVATGITPGSGPGHLALFGYDPVKNLIGRGALSAAGVNFPQKPGDVMARVNFCTIDAKGIVLDRRAGRIPDEKCRELCEKATKSVKIEGVEFFLLPEKEHRAALIIRGEGLDPNVSDTDPQATGVPYIEPAATADTAASKRTAELLSDAIRQIRDILADERPANCILLRGISGMPVLPTIGELYGLKGAAIAAYPMYKGLARIAGFDVVEGVDSTDSLFDAIEGAKSGFDFIFGHFKKTDSAGEDGDFDRKVAAIEEADAGVGRLATMGFDVICITGDHSTPSAVAGHSWHSVPFIIQAKLARVDGVAGFDEIEAAKGCLGKLPAADLMGLLLAHAGRLAKFGA